MRASARSALILTFLGLGALAAVPVPEAGRARFDGAVGTKVPALGVGGLSGLELSPDGTGLTAVSDAGVFVTGRLQRRAGRLSALVDLAVWPMQGPGGAALPGTDSEGLAQMDGGPLFVSFERYEGGVMRFDDPAAPGLPLPDPVGFELRHDNRGLELLAVAPDGSLFTLPEWPDATGLFPVFRYRNGAWDKPFSIAPEGRFSPVGADIGPDGQLYLLERRLIAPFGFRSQVRRFALGEEGPGRGRTVLKTGLGRHGNLEGLSVWRDGDGRLRLTMVSDDNFLALQRGQIVEYVLDEAPGDG